MASVYSNLATNDVATPRVINNAIGNGDLKEASARVAVSATQASGDIAWMHRLPSNCRVSEVLLTAADATTAGAIDIGLYYPPELGGAALDADFFASALALTGGPFAESDQKGESTTYTLEKQQQPLWQAAGLSADPGGEFYLCLTYTTTGNGAPTEIGIKTRYTV